ncbi:MAG: hypothetical protein M3440_06655, partial [Chloroflexota bacterium]|nr:hypothetical protein [Chloroflexota bacterium]
MTDRDMILDRSRWILSYLSGPASLVSEARDSHYAYLIAASHYDPDEEELAQTRTDIAILDALLALKATPAPDASDEALDNVYMAAFNKGLTRVSTGGDDQWKGRRLAAIRAVRIALAS